ncbi:MAG: hypothetical protein A6D92_11635 [Symbiobacterium thermophilum]|uniref:Glycine dehydrogenase C-terminal domain-containing protein n=1 Tax=Symbiobacterium thermophilum TaxID=2734 RepID=A0A1Y2T6T5_SYMTR|nr:MAG: hypothetical protein A6D92_11635 [Symbiobacterium thermophilum]
MLNANYVLARLKEYYEPFVDRYCMHECVLSARTLKQETGVKTLDVAKRLLDEGLHPPTIYFPLIVEEALMIEPTETEDKATLDRFIDAMIRIYEEARSNPDYVKSAPHKTPVGRLDEALAARRPNLRYRANPT